MKEIQRPMSSSFQERGCHRRDSVELDIFEATQYFSGEVGTPRIAAKESKRKVDMPIESKKIDISYVKEKVEIKQPSSPGGRLASFLNSLFRHSSSQNKKKKKKKKPSKSLKADEEQEKLTKKNSAKGTKSETFYNSSSSSGGGFGTANSLYYNKRNNVKTMAQEEEFRREEDGAESDSSSDLFELKNYELYDAYSDLPVFGSTDVRIINRGTVRFASADLPAKRW